MTREERQKYLQDKRAQEAQKTSTPQGQQDQAKLQEAIKNRKTKYNRAIGKLEIID